MSDDLGGMQLVSLVVPFYNEEAGVNDFYSGRRPDYQ